MIRDLQHLQTSVFSKLHLIISQLQQDSECEEYLGYNFQISHFNIKFRKAKITPKKIGQFVTLWKRNPESRQTEPFNQEDPFLIFILLPVILMKNQVFSYFLKIFCRTDIFLRLCLKKEKEASEFIRIGIFLKTNKPKRLRIGKRNFSSTFRMKIILKNSFQFSVSTYNKNSKKILKNYLCD